MEYKFYGWETATVTPINNIYPSIHSFEITNAVPIELNA